MATFFLKTGVGAIKEELGKKRKRRTSQFLKPISGVVEILLVLCKKNAYPNPYFNLFAK